MGDVIYVDFSKPKFKLHSYVTCYIGYRYRMGKVVGFMRTKRNQKGIYVVEFEGGVRGLFYETDLSAWTGPTPSPEAS